MFKVITALGQILLITMALAASPVWADAADVQALLTSSTRSEQDRARDQRDKAAELMSFMDITEGAQVVDIFAGGGYWSELFAAAVGPKGKVLVHNNAAYKKYVGPDVDKRFMAKPLPQIKLYEREVNDLDLVPASQDVIFMSLSFHDLYFVDEAQGWPAIDAPAFIQQLADALVTGGRLIIVDHEAQAGSGVSAAQTLHRIEAAKVETLLAPFGFKRIGQSALLENPKDPKDISVFDASIRGKTSRFIHIYEKQPKG